jgi:hypothetical protein
MTRGERQDSLEQFIGKSLFLFKKREMARVVKPDKLLVRSLNALKVLPNQGRTTVGVLSSFKKEQRYTEVWPELTQIDFGEFPGKGVREKDSPWRKL